VILSSAGMLSCVNGLTRVAVAVIMTQAMGIKIEAC
jgi:hypothetical protein